jgi:succinoglycan biosynthesis transport protein ExoP
MPHDLVPTTSGLPMAFRVPSDRPAPSPISQLLFVIFKWRRLILALALAFTLAAIALAILKPPVRTASAKVLFKQDRAALQISGQAAPASRLPYSPQALQSEVELFRSRSVLRPVAVESLGPKPTNGEIEGKINGLRGNLVVAMVPDTSIIQVTYSGRSTTEAEKTLEKIINSYMEQHAAAFRDAPGVLAFYEQETSRAATELHNAEEALTKWQEANSTVAIEPEINAQLDKLGTLQKAVNQTEAEIQGTQARLATLERLSKGQPERAVMMRERVPNPLIAKLQADLAGAEVALKEAASVSPLVGKLKADLVAAEVALEDLRRRYTDRDRVVVEKKEQVAQLRQEVANAEKAAVDVAQERVKQVKTELATAQAEANIAGRESVGPNPLREGLDRDFLAARAQFTALTSQRDALHQQTKEAATALAALRDKRVGVERLLRNVALTRESYLGHAKRLEEARITAGLDKKNLSDLAIVEAPHSTGESDLMKRILIVVLASVVGLGLGVAAAFTIEFFNNAVRTSEDVEFYVGLPVVATIPALPASAGRLTALSRAALVPGAKSNHV